jgi:hypothetical protein
MGVPDVNLLLDKILADNGIGTADFTGKIHALKYKAPLYLRPGNAIGIVMHNTSGMVTLPNLVGTWKSKEPNPPPSHLAIDQSGQVGRYVRLQYADRATENTNRHLSIEFQAVANGSITIHQIKSAALITAFANVIYGVEFAIAQSESQLEGARPSFALRLQGQSQWPLWLSRRRNHRDQGRDPQAG